VLKEELTAIRDKLGDERKTEIMDVEDEIDIEDLIEEEDCVFTLTNAGYLKRTPTSTYRAQKRGGRGVSGQALREEDYVSTLMTCSTHDFILFFTNLGKVHRKKGYQIPEAGRTAKGTAIVNVLPLEPEEKVTAMMFVREFSDQEYIVMATKNGTVKRITLDSINTARKSGIRALTLEEGDQLISVRRTDGSQNVLLCSRDGMSICFQESDIRCMGRDAVGVRGMKLREGDCLVGMEIVSDGESLLTVTENGYGKRTALEEYTVQNRGGMGLKNYNLTDKTGLVASVAMVSPGDDVMMISDDGVVIRTAAEGINLYGRVTQGVRVMNMGEGVKLIAAVKMVREEEDSDEEEAPADTAETAPEEE
jgi:DNA gyrase subunit A